MFFLFCLKYWVKLWTSGKNIFSIALINHDFNKWYLWLWSFPVEKNGDVCISILHEPGDDKWGYEKASERWLPVHTVETILISVISMLADPNDESPANVDAAVSWYFIIVFLNINGVSFMCND